MDWSEIDLEAKTWTLPPERTKNDEAHVVPLSPLAVDQLRAMSPKRSGLVFTTTGKTPISGFSKAKRTLDEHMLRIITERFGHLNVEMIPIVIPEWRFHDIRRTGATNLQALGIPIEVTEAVLNHISGTRAGVAGIYNRYKYDAEKQKALELWDKKITELLSSSPIC